MLQGGPSLRGEFIFSNSMLWKTLMITCERAMGTPPHKLIKT